MGKFFDEHATAAGIVDLINESMLGALRVVTVQKGRSPADFALVSFGGAGGLHANAVAALLGCYPVIVHPESGVLSALGFVVSPIKNEFSQTVIRDAEETSADELRERLGALAVQGDRWLADEGVEGALFFGELKGRLGRSRRLGLHPCPSLPGDRG